MIKLELNKPSAPNLRAYFLAMSSASKPDDSVYLAFMHKGYKAVLTCALRE